MSLVDALNEESAARKGPPCSLIAILAALDSISAAHGVSVTAVSLAWLAAQPTVATPIASARVVEQLPDLLQMTGLELSPSELDELSAVSV